MSYPSHNELIHALYQYISFAEGEKPDYQTLKRLFHAGAILMPPRTNPEVDPEVLTVDDFIRMSQNFLANSDFGKRGFIEKEIARREERFGNILHIMSAYTGTYADESEALQVRGVNSIQLIYERERWYVVSMTWDTERDNNPLPEWATEND